MAATEDIDNIKNPYLLMIRPNQWIKSNQYKHCTLIRINDEEFNFFYTSPNVWVQIMNVNKLWFYYPLGNKTYESKSYNWLGDLLDDAVESMIRAKL